MTIREYLNNLGYSTKKTDGQPFILDLDYIKSEKEEHGIEINEKYFYFKNTNTISWIGYRQEQVK